MRYLLLLLALFTFSVASLKAQNAEHEAILKPVHQLFEAMQKGDSALLHATFDPDVHFGTIYQKEGQTKVHQEASGDNFLKALGTPHEKVWDERIHDVKVQQDGDMAMVWAPYKFYLGGEFSHCGVNLFTLVRKSKQWYILSITDTRRTTGCE